jgi:hypothetical protein
MSSPFLHQGSDQSTAVPAAKHAGGVSPPSRVRITVIIRHRHSFDTGLATGRQIKDRQVKGTANVPAGFALYRRVQGGDEPIPDHAQVELHRGDHFFARPTSSVS